MWARERPDGLKPFCSPIFQEAKLCTSLPLRSRLALPLNVTNYTPGLASYGKIQHVPHPQNLSLLAVFALSENITKKLQAI